MAETTESNPSMPAIPADLVAQREALHRLATYVIGPARYQQTERFGLRATEGGFGTPEFGDPPMRIRVTQGGILVEQGSETRSAPITSLAAAAEFIGSTVDLETAAEHDSPPAGDVDGILDVTDEIINFLGDWWGLGTGALEQLRGDDVSVDPSIVQLWPGHFDTAIEEGNENRRSSYGASPGDGTSDEPYLYVSVWWPDRLVISEGDYWNAEGFVGARMTYSELRGTADPQSAAADFYRQGRDLLASSPDA